MVRVIRSFLLIYLIFLCHSTYSQGFNIGIRAGLSQTKFNGPLEKDFGESYSLNGGFHFGLSFQWNFNDLIGLRSEVVYNQMGSSYKLDTDNGYYVFPQTLNNFETPILRDTSLINLNHSNAYIQLPQTVHFSIGEKLELFAGGYIGFLVSPVATGTVTFGGPSGSQEHSFRQGLNFNYFSDDAETINDIFTQRVEDIEIRVDGLDVDIFGITNSYNFMEFNIDRSRFLSIDWGLVGGASYYLNRGLFIMGRVEYGVRDITRNTTDYSFARVNDDKSPVFNNDSDRNLGFYLSLGFKF